jgi:hypothetical protein
MTDRQWETIVDGTSGTEAVQTEPGKVYLEWVGQPSPFDDPTIQFLMLRNRLDKGVKDIIRALARRRIARIDGISRRVVFHGDNDSRAIKGLSQTWTFGPRVTRKPGQPGSYIHLVPNRDADLILGSSMGHEFRVIGLAQSEPDPVLIFGEKIKRNKPEAVLTAPKEYRRINDFHRDMGVPKTVYSPVQSSNRTTSRRRS